MGVLPPGAQSLTLKKLRLLRFCVKDLFLGIAVEVAYTVHVIISQLQATNIFLHILFYYFVTPKTTIQR